MKCQKKSFSFNRFAYHSIIRLCVFFVILSLLVGSIIVSYYWLRQTQSECNQSGSMIGNLMENRLSEVNRISYSLMNNQDIRMLFSGRFSNEYEKYISLLNIDSLLLSVVSSYDYIDICFVLTDESRVYTNLVSDNYLGYIPLNLTFNYFNYDPDLLQEQEWYISAQKNTRSGTHYADNFYVPGIQCGHTLSVITEINNAGHCVGYIAILIQEEWLKPIYMSSGDPAAIFGSGDIPLYSYNDEKTDLLGSSSALRFNNRIIRLDDGHIYYLWQREYSNYGLKLVIAQDLQGLFLNLYWTIVAFLLASLLLVPVVYQSSRTIARKMSAPIEILIDEIRQQDSFGKIAYPAEATEEIVMLVDHLNTMNAHLEMLLTDLYNSRLAEKNAEIAALKQQINPHFLNNTIEIINSMALIEGCEDISLITEHLGIMFRYGLEISDHSVPLSRELDYLESYIEINRLRGLNFRWTHTVPEECRTAKVQKMILQPIVENSFIHGFIGNARLWTIDLTVVKDGSDLQITITDNGIGINAEKMEQIHQMYESPTGESADGLGLANVHRRLQLTFGAKYGLTISSNGVSGSVVTIRLPFIKE